MDKIGITKAVRLGIERGLNKLKVDHKEVSVKLDGLLHAPAEYMNQETIIKGDAKEKVIGLASIMAKVTRDRVMVKMAKKYPVYQFEIHKGYGTKKHLEAIEKHGLSTVHRRSFCKRFN
ncbi:MAG: ribonuclease HII [Candidatus Paceibacterota bacterium]